MESLFTVENFISLGLLTLLQAVLGLDNLLYISLESKRAPLDQQKRVRQIGIGGLVMIWLAGKVTEFLKKNRMYEVLGLFILLIVGIMLLSEGGHLAHLHFFGNAITPMSKTTFYFVIAVLVIVDVVQGRYQKNLNKHL